MSPDMEAALTESLRINTDVFAWKLSDMPGLNIRTLRNCHTLPQHQSQHQARAAMPSPHRQGEAQGNRRGARQAPGRRLDQGGSTPRLASHPRPCQEEEWEVENARRLYRPQQGLPE